MRLLFFLTALMTALPGTAWAAGGDSFEATINEIFGPFTKAA